MNDRGAGASTGSGSTITLGAGADCILCGIGCGIALPELGVAIGGRAVGTAFAPFVPFALVDPFEPFVGVPATGVCGRAGTTAAPVIVGRGGAIGGFAVGAGGRSGGAGGFAAGGIGGFVATPATGVIGFVGGSDELAGIGGFIAVAGAPAGGVAVRGAVTDFARGAPAGVGTNGFGVAAAIGCVVR